MFAKQTRRVAAQFLSAATAAGQILMIWPVVWLAGKWPLSVACRLH